MLGEYFLVFSPFFKESIVVFKKSCIFAPHLRNQHAQMAESVDALVSNTSGFTSIPVRPRVWVRKEENRPLQIKSLQGFFLFSTET